MADILKDTQVKADKQKNYELSFEKMKKFLNSVKGKLWMDKFNIIVVLNQADKVLSLVRKVYHQMKKC